MSLLQSIPRVLDTGDEDEDETTPGLPSPASESSPSTGVSTPAPEESSDSLAVDLKPELGTVAHGKDGEAVKLWRKLDFTFAVSSINLELFDAKVTDQESLKSGSIAKFSLISTRVNFKILSDGSMDAEVMLRDVTMSNTRQGESVWREIIPAAVHDGDQLRV